MNQHPSNCSGQDLLKVYFSQAHFSPLCPTLALCNKEQKHKCFNSTLYYYIILYNIINILYYIVGDISPNVLASCCSRAVSLCYYVCSSLFNHTDKICVSYSRHLCRQTKSQVDMKFILNKLNRLFEMSK